MKKSKIYFIAPIVVLIAFGAYYWSFSSQYEAKQAAIAQVAKEARLAKLKADAEQREKAIQDAIDAQAQRKKERAERDARERQQRDDLQNAQLAASKADQDSQRLARQVERLTKDIAAAKEDIAKIEASNKDAVAQEAFLEEYVKQAEINHSSLAAVLTKIQAADDALAKAAAIAAAKAKANQ